jgi:uncharacterized OsmC-like protein
MRDRAVMRENTQTEPRNEKMECKVTWMGPEGMSFVAQTGSGHIVAMDGAPDGGGNNLAPGPWKWCCWAPAAAHMTWC